MSFVPQRKGKKNCCVVECDNNYGNTPKSVSFYRFPRDDYIGRDRRMIWINAVKRINKDGSKWIPTKNTRICSQHFINGKKSEHPRDPAYNPTIFPWSKTVADTSRFQNRDEIEEIADQTNEVPLETTAEASSQTDFNIVESNISVSQLTVENTFFCSFLMIAENEKIVHSSTQTDIVSKNIPEKKELPAKPLIVPSTPQPLSNKDSNKFQGYNSLREKENFGDLCGVSKATVKMAEKFEFDANIPVKNEYFLDKMEFDIDDGVSSENWMHSHDDVDIKDEIEIGETLLYDEYIGLKQADFFKGIDIDIKEESSTELGVVHKNESFDNVTISKGNDNRSQINCDPLGTKNECFDGVNSEVFGNNINNCELIDCEPPTDSDKPQETRLINPKKYKCDYCHFTSSWCSSLKVHIKAVHLKLKDHKCEYCDYTSSSSGHLKQHIEDVHLKLKKHKCGHCDYTSNRPSSLKAHMKDVHLKLKDHKCKYCDYTSSSAGYLKSHVKVVHFKLKEHKCEHCDYTSSQFGRLRAHIKTIHLKLKEHKCHYCDYTSSCSGNLKKHIKAVHLKLREHKCEHCDYTSSQSSTLKTHIKTVHLQLKEHNCEHCDYTSSQSSTLKTHIKTVHLQLKEHNCEHCDYTSSRSIDLKLHMKTHHLKPNNHKCEHCDYTSSRFGDLKVHIKTVHLKLKDQKCEHCDYRSSQSGTLKQHIKAVHLNLRDKKCDYCDYTAINPGKIKTHINAVHLKLKKHKCEHCDYTSSTSGNLKVHVKAVHLKLKEQKCEQCDFTASQSSHLKRHIKIVHLKIKE